jgi:tRNA(fMet)-specific endonuclease VapC
MVRYLLDTNVLSDAMRDPNGPLARRLKHVPPDDLGISVVVAAELRYGASLRRSDRLSRAVEEVLASIDILPLEPPVDQIYGKLRAELETAGRPLDGNDLLIASHALAEGRVLVTADAAFARVHGLTVEDWRA